ncbi:hypothetical protein DERF_006101 [Dermatophagoides farinae]|uniref:Uncharacterized protein n=1 Tax=Dermatophagoides farinae TaxID=6954 RepID=A0A922L9D2_DERFA|nr:hypothetical protein DERF_006101 [Dermatophagoides farinae]
MNFCDIGQIFDFKTNHIFSKHSLRNKSLISKYKRPVGPDINQAFFFKCTKYETSRNKTEKVIAKQKKDMLVAHI